MATLFDDLPPCSALAKIAKDFHARNWMAGTAGNLSKRAADESSFWITASGKPKGQLDEQDFVRVNVLDGVLVETPKPENKPSAETSIHQVIYQLFPQAKACLHVHTVDAYHATARFAKQDQLLLPAIEMIKGFDIWEQHPTVYLPVFDNILDVKEIAKAIHARFQQQTPRVTALMIKDHGVTVWGKSLQEAYNRVEILEFIMSYLARNA